MPFDCHGLILNGKYIKYILLKTFPISAKHGSYFYSPYKLPIYNFENSLYILRTYYFSRK